MDAGNNIALRAFPAEKYRPSVPAGAREPVLGVSPASRACVGIEALPSAWFVQAW